MIKHIVFDLGRVLLEFDTTRYALLAGVPEKDLEKFKNCVYRSPYWLNLERGKADEEASVRAMCAALPEELHEAVRSTVMGWWEYPIIPVDGMRNLVTKLKKNGYGIYLLSNARKHAREYFKRVPGNECFDGELFSFETGFLKPEHEMFEILFDRYNLCGSECYFVDDDKTNVEAAINAGMSAFVFRNDLETLVSDMKEHGITI